MKPMTQRTASKIILPAFTLTEVCAPTDEGACQRRLVGADGASLAEYTYRATLRPVAYSPTGPTYSYNQMPVVLDGFGAPWHEANLYILARLENALTPSMLTYQGIADDLAAFRRFLEEDGINYTDFPRRKPLRPTYRYRAWLQQLIEAGEIAPATARRRIAAVIGFYRWLVNEELLTPENPLWEEHDVYIQLTDSKGFRRSRAVTATDLSVRVPTQNDPYAGTVNDGGHLRPLPIEEQLAILEALRHLGNTEMTLVHMIALFTGARIQTVLTFRVGHVMRPIQAKEAEVRLPVGPGTGIDTKNDKRMSLHLPAWLYEKLRTYAGSKRARARRMKAGEDRPEQYLFLTSRGAPMYAGKDLLEYDAQATIRHQKQGQAVRQYMRDFIIPEVQKRLGSEFHYRFHDLRASFGMNLTDQQLALVQQGRSTLHQVREFVKTRMGHESSATTDLYLQYRKNAEMVKNVQQAYEGHLKHLIDAAMAL